MKNIIPIICLSLFFLACQKIEEINYIPFQAGFTAPKIVRVGELVAFTANTSTTGAQNFFWKFGDIKKRTSQEENPLFAYDTIGEYIASLRVEMVKKNGVRKDSSTQKIFALPTTYSSASGLYEQFTYGGNFGIDEISMDFTATTDGGFAIVAQQNLHTIYVTRLNADLQLNPTWTTFEFNEFGNAPVYPQSIIQTSDNGFLIVGYIQSGIADSDAFILKLNQNGAIEWRNTETNSSNYERYTDVLETPAKNEYVVVGSIGKTSNTSLVVLHKIDAQGDYIAKAEISNYKNCHAHQIKQKKDDTDYFITGTYTEQPVIINVNAALALKGITRMAFVGEAKEITFLTGNDVFITGRGYTDGSETLEDSTSYAFASRFDAINGAAQNWTSKAKMYRERYVDAFELNTTNIICIGEHYNPNSGRDLLFTKINAQNGKITKVSLLGDEADHRPVQAIYNAVTGYVYVLATTPELISDKNSRYDICIVKTKIADIL